MTLLKSMNSVEWRQVRTGVELLGKGGIIACPTDTVFGLSADFSSDEAVQRIIDIKGRSVQMGLPLLLSAPEDLSLVARDISDTAWLLAKHFWPGGLTLVVLRSATVSDLVTGGRETVAVRLPGHPIPQALVRGLGRPITGTSANLTGQAPALTAGEARIRLGALVDLVIDGGDTTENLQSTIIDTTCQTLTLLRDGVVSLSAIRSVYRGNIEYARSRSFDGNTKTSSA